MTKITVIAGAQFGSEAKGHITAQVIKGYTENDPEGRFNIVNVRVAGPNAGHTVVDANGEHIALRQIPVGAAVTPNATLYIAPGSEVDLPVVVTEIQKLRQLGHPVDKLHISGEATLLEEHHIREEQANDLSGKLGSTAKGIGAARADRIWRGAKRVKDDAHTCTTLEDLGVTIVQNDLDFWEEYRPGTPSAIVIEGTQGYGLGLHSGHYPYCTSSDTRAIDFIAMSGYPYMFSVSIEVLLVARMYPIRVAGNSGEISGETSWDELGLPEERTTVTQKVRRVGEWDQQLINDAVRANGGPAATSPIELILGGSAHDVAVALTMVDQKWPTLEGLSGNASDVDRLVHAEAEQNPKRVEEWNALREFVLEQAAHGVRIGAVTTSASTIVTDI